MKTKCRRRAIRTVIKMGTGASTAAGIKATVGQATLDDLKASFGTLSPEEKGKMVVALTEPTKPAEPPELFYFKSLAGCVLHARGAGVTLRGAGPYACSMRDSSLSGRFPAAALAAVERRQSSVRPLLAFQSSAPTLCSASRPSAGQR